MEHCSLQYIKNLVAQQKIYYSFNLHVVLKKWKWMELVDKPSYKSAVWKHFSPRCDEKKCPVIYGYLLSWECKNRVAACNENTSNQIAHLQKNTQLFTPTLLSKKLRKANKTKVIKAPHSKNRSQRCLLAANCMIKKAKLTNSVT